MIVQGKKGTYDVRIRQYGYSSASILLYEPPKPKLFGFIPLPQRLLYEEDRAKYAIDKEKAMDMTDEQRVEWFLTVIDWYETYHARWKEVLKQ